jgi:hypothetical protein
MNDEEAIAVQETVPVPAAVASSRVHGTGPRTPGAVNSTLQIC